MRAKRILFTAFVITLLFSLTASSTIIRVPQDQPTIQAGINAAVNGDTVLVAPGSYPGHLNISSKNISLLTAGGADSTELVATTSNTPIVYCASVDTNARIRGFTIRGASEAAAVRCDAAYPVIEQNIIRNNSGGHETHHGITALNPPGKVIIRNNVIKSNPGGIMVGEGAAVISGNIVDGNIGSPGGGIFLRGGSGSKIERNLITNNSSSLGGGVIISGTQLCVIRNNTVANNTGGDGAGVLLWYSSGPSVFNNIIAGNGPAYGLRSESTDGPYVAYNDVWNNLPSDYAGIGPGIGSLSLDPQFEGGVPVNYELQPTSLCIDVGDPATPVPDGGGLRVDMGAFEYFGLGLVAPGNGASIIARQPAFLWTRVRNTSIPAAYRAILDTAADFASADSSLPLSDTTWVFPYQLKLYQTYFWKVVAVTDSGDTSFSNVRAFSVSPKLALYAPANSSRVLVKQPVFEWQAMRDSTIPDTFSYRVVYSTNSDFTGAVSSPLLSDTVWQPPLPLAAGYTYYWKGLAFYSVTPDTVVPVQTFSFLLAPTRIEVPLDRPTIQQAIDISLNGDTVMVSPGTYVQNILFRGKKIKVLSQGGPEITMLAKLVDGAPMVTFSGSEDSNAVLCGFTIRGARLVSSGAGVSMVNASPVIENNYFFDNAGDTAVLYVRNGAPKIRRNLIANNNTGVSAIGFFGGSGGTVIHNTVASNNGDAVRITPAPAFQIINNILSLNGGYGIRSAGGVNSSSVIDYNDIFSNALGTYFAAIPASGDIYDNPQFVGGDPFDYHLSDSSPCIDAGDPSFPAPPGGGVYVDMGAFEFYGLRGDLNRDGILSPTDVVLELNCVFLATGSCSLGLVDLNCDGACTPTDVVLILNLVFLGVSLPC